MAGWKSQRLPETSRPAKPPVLLQVIAQEVHDDPRRAAHFGRPQIAEHHEGRQAVGTSTREARPPRASLKLIVSKPEKTRGKW